MSRFAIRLMPEQLNNPDLDIRYVLPDLIVERSGGAVKDDGYDYGGPGDDSLFIFLVSDDTQSAQKAILDVIENVTVLDNDLRGAVAVAILGAEDVVVYPPGFIGEFGRPKD